MAKREFNTEQDLLDYKSKVLLLPKKLLVKINQMIDENHREWAICNMLRREYTGSLMPTEPTMGVYISWYEAKKKMDASKGIVTTPTNTQLSIIEDGELTTISKERQNILDSNTDITNKKDLLERLIRKCISRIKTVEFAQEEGTTASLEAVIGHYIREIHSLVQTQLKLSGELQEESNKHISDLINTSLYQLTQLFFGVVQDVVPDQLEAIKTKFYAELQAKKELLEALSTPEQVSP